MGTFISDFVSYCEKKYPSLRSLENLAPQIENTLSPEVMPLPASAYRRAQEAVSKIYEFAHRTEWLAELSTKLTPDLKSILSAKAPPSSILMAYDFHYQPTSDRLSLIEINTNASMYLPCAALYDLHNLKFADAKKTPIESLRDSFFAEWCSFGHNKKTPKVAIVDEDLTKQKMYFEFLMYKDLLAEWGWSAEVVDIQDLKIEQFDFIYNRFVDFYFTDNRSKALLQAWQNQSVFVSPQPREYLLLSDKERLIDFYKHKVDQCLLPTELLTETFKGKVGAELDSALDETWSRRKQLFFKPRNMYGGKAAFRGESISRRVFSEIIGKDFIAQEFQPAGEYKGRKFDLRFFVYRNEIQLGCARLYTGQTTNFNSPGGGLAPITLT